MHVDELLRLERQLIHLAETQSCLEETISHLKRQHQVLEKQARAPRVSVHTSETEFGIVSTTLSCCEEKLQETALQQEQVREEQAMLINSQNDHQVQFEAASPQSPYETQSRWFSLDHLWNMHTALWLMLPPDSNIIVEFSFEGLFLCEGAEAAERIKYFHSAGIDFIVPEGHQCLVYDILCDYIDAVKDWKYHSITCNCQHFAGELYCDLVRGLRFVGEWPKSKDFLFKRMSDRWCSDWGKPVGDPFLYGDELEWSPWKYHDLWPSNSQHLRRGERIEDRMHSVYT
jgi:hypothetical protein